MAHTKRVEKRAQNALDAQTCTLKETKAACVPHNYLLIKQIALNGRKKSAVHAIGWLDRNGFDVSEIAINRNDEVADDAVALISRDEKKLVHVALNAKNSRSPMAALRCMAENHWWYASIAEVLETSTDAETKRIARELIESPSQIEIGLMANASRFKDLMALALFAEGKEVAGMAAEAVVRISEQSPPTERKERLEKIRDSAANPAARALAAREVGTRAGK